ncbi:MAG: flippase-like domain-containing protein [Candidatus Wallbacteria bacterium]|nr:flippase-like domain-containing protein [Candidatus Wallbacteria bacterium]
MSFPVKLLLSAVAGLLVFAGVGYFLDTRAILAALSSLSLAYVPLILGLAITNYVFRFAKWQYYLRTIGIVIPARESLAIYLSGFMMAVTPGKLGEVLKAYLLKRMYGTKMRVTAPVVLAERITDVVALLILSIAGATALHYGERVLWLAVALTASLLLALSSRSLAVAVIGVCERLPVIERVAHKLHEAYDSMAALLRTIPLAIGTAVSVPAWACEGVAFYCIFVGMRSAAPGAVPPLGGAVFIYAFSTLVGALSMLPGGLGAAEAGLAGLAVSLFGVPRGVAGAATLIVRLLTLWFAVALGAAVFAACRGMFGIGFGEVGEVKREE